MSTVCLEDAENGKKVWAVPCEHTQYPYDRAAYENRLRDGLGTLENGLPAWPVAEENGIAFKPSNNGSTEAGRAKELQLKGFGKLRTIRMINGKSLHRKKGYQFAHIAAVFRLAALKPSPQLWG